MRWRSTVISLGVALSATATNAQEAAVLSETREGGQGVEMYQELGGRWNNSEGKSTAPGATQGIGSRWADISGGPQGAKASWTFTPPADGLYIPQVTWSGSGNSIGVQYNVTAGGQTASHPETQDGFGFEGPRNGNQWISLGEAVQGGPSNPIVIEVSDETVSGQPDPISSGRVYTDAARLIDAAGATTTPRPRLSLTSAPPPAVPAAPPQVSTPRPEVIPPAPAPTPAASDAFGDAASTTLADAGTTSTDEDLFEVPSTSTITESTTANTTINTPATTAFEPIPPITASTATTTGVAWADDYAGALRLAQSMNKPLLLNFITERSRDARRMEAETWRNSGVIATVSERYVAARIPMESNPQLAATMGVYRSPTTLIVNTEGDEPEVIDRIVGFTTATEILARIR